MHQLTMPRTPQKNNITERRNQTIIECARSMGITSNFPHFLWTKLVNTANVFINISPTCANYGVIVNKLYYNSMPQVNHLQIFGSLCYLHVLKESRFKLQSKTKCYFFIGYDAKSKAYRLYEPHEKKIYISLDIIFDEQQVGYKLVSKQEHRPIESNLFLAHNTIEEILPKNIITKDLTPPTKYTLTSKDKELNISPHHHQSISQILPQSKTHPASSTS